MHDIIIRSGLDIVGRTERMIETAKQLLYNGSLDEVELCELDYEIERLKAVVFAADEAIRTLARTAECRPQAGWPHGPLGTLH